MDYYVKADRFLLEAEEKQTGYLHVKNGQFGAFVHEIPAHAHVVDWSGYTIAPGLFDTHIHGVQGYDVMDGDVEAIEEISKAIIQQGVTRFLPTTLTSSDTQLEKAILAVTTAVKNGLSGAQSEGIFLEGPYFTEKHKGAQNAHYFRDPSVVEFKKWQDLAKGHITKIALAPERNGAVDFIRSTAKENIHVSIAHSEASYDCCLEAVDAGASIFVHLFNGMSGLHHRDPGVVGTALIHEQTFAELIVDGHHTHPDVAKLALQIKGNNLVLITDCMRAGLMPDGTYELGEYTVNVKGGIALTDTGSLAGSTLTLLEGIKNLQKWTGQPLYKIWHLGSLSPARSVGREGDLGSIAYGKRADFVVLDHALDVQATAIDGIITYEKS